MAPFMDPNNLSPLQQQITILEHLFCQSMLHNSLGPLHQPDFIQATVCNRVEQKHSMVTQSLGYFSHHRKCMYHLSLVILMDVLESKSAQTQPGF